MSAERNDEMNVGELIVALTDIACRVMGDKKKAYQVVACLISDLMLPAGTSSPDTWH